MTPFSRCATLLTAVLFALACGGATLSVLHAKGRPRGDGPAHIDVKNSSGVSIDQLYIAKSEDVAQARARGVSPGSDADVALWGADHLGNGGLSANAIFPALELDEGRYDVLAVDPDKREELVKGIRVHAGGRYVLEIGDTWALTK
ncbi:MAG TPA: hypothetical protein VH142_03480 [Polyangiaceae bacterium]|jgi:hypothetical protein|nr:hypothetical protein [Polyangiaceae bacterium]